MGWMAGVLDDPPGFPYTPPGVDVLEGGKLTSNNVAGSSHDPLQSFAKSYRFNRIDFKILLITYKALNGLAPQYLSELLSHYSPSRPLRSQNSGHLIIPRISKSTAGGRSFSYLAPKLWNNLPNTVREADTLCQFKSRLKTHLFNLAYT